MGVSVGMYLCECMCMSKCVCGCVCVHVKMCTDIEAFKKASAVHDVTTFLAAIRRVEVY